jgi:ubiquinone/menaquinone biosynthesis C-methylase UbiE
MKRPDPSTVRKQYSRQAAAYDARWAAYLADSIGPTLEALAPVPGERILDLGCGTGMLLRKIAATSPTTVAWGVDLSAEMLRGSPGRDAVTGATLADAHHLPFGTGRFDAVVSTSSLHHWHDPRGALLEIGRVLKPRGRLVLTDWANDHLPTRIVSAVLRHTDASHFRSYTAREARRLLGAAGFETESTRLHRSGWKWGFFTIVATRSPDGSPHRAD